MKKRFTILIPVLALFVAMLVGCLSAQSYLDRGDPVSAIEKLSSILAKKPTDQEAADLFVSVYPSEVENRLQYTERSVDDVINDFVRAQGSSTLGSALQKKKSSLSSGRFLADDPDIRSVLRESETIYKNLKDLNRIQKAVVKVPQEIGDDVKGETYYVEKFSDNFSGMYSDAGRSIAEFYYAIGDAASPGNTREEKKQVYEIYGKVGEYTTGLSGINNKRAQAAYNVAEDYLSGSTISEKKEALSWFNKARSAVSNYNDTTRRIQETNYQIALLYMKGVDEYNPSYQSASDLRYAITYFEDAGNYRDAPERLARAKELLYKLENPVVEEGTTDTSSSSGTSSSGSSGTSGSISQSTHNKITCLSPVVYSKVGNQVYAHIAFIIDEELSLGMNNIVPILNSGRATPVEFSYAHYRPDEYQAIKEKCNVRIPAGNAYMITLSVKNSGTFSYSITDNGGWAYTMVDSSGRNSTSSPTYNISADDISRLTVPAGAVEYAAESVYYPNRSGEAYVEITVYDLMTTRYANHIRIAKNNTGASIARVDKKRTGSNYTTYAVVFTGIKSAGHISFFVLNDFNEYMPVRRMNGRSMETVQNPNTSTIPEIYLLPSAVNSKDVVTYSRDFDYPEIEKTVHIPFSLSFGSSSYTLTKNNVSPVLNTTGGTVTAVTESSRGRYFITLSGVTKSGQFMYQLYDQNGYAIVSTDFSMTSGAGGEKSASPVYSINLNQLYTKPTVTIEVPEVEAIEPEISYGNMEYTDYKSAGECAALIHFTVSNYSGSIGTGNIKIATNGTGGYISAISADKDAEITPVKASSKTSPKTKKAVARPMGSSALTRKYAAKVSGVKQSGSISFYVLDSKGNVIAPAGSGKNFTPKSYSISKSKFYNISEGNVSYGTPTYPQNESAVYIPITVTGGVKPASFQFGSQTISSSSIQNVRIVASDASRGLYNIVIPGSCVEKSGKFESLVRDENGLVITTNGYMGPGDAFLPVSVSIDRSKMYVPAQGVVVYGSPVYSTNSNLVSLEFTVGDTSERLSASNIKIITNTTGGTMVSLSNPSSGKYSVNIENVKNDGVITFEVYDNRGKLMPCRSGGRTTTVPANYVISKSKIYTNPTGSITYGDGEYSKTASQYIVQFTLYDYPSTVKKANVVFTSNTCNASVNSLSSTGNSSQRNVTMVLEGFNKNGTFQFTMKDDSGNNLSPKSGTKGKIYEVSLDRIWANPTFTNGKISYSKTEPTASIAFTITGLNYVLNKDNIRILNNATGASWNLTNNATNPSALSSKTSVTYTITLSNISKSGKFEFTALAPSGAQLNKTWSFDIDKSKVYVPPKPSIGYGSTCYGLEGQVEIIFVVNLLTTPRAMKHIKTVTNTTGGTLTSLRKGNSGSNWVQYYVTLSNVKNDGILRFDVLDDSNNPIPAEVADDVNPNYTIKVADIHSPHSISYGTDVAYPNTEKSVSIPFTVTAKGSAPTFTKNSIVVLTNETGGSIKDVTSAGNGKWNINLTGVTSSGKFSYRVKDATGYTLVPASEKTNNAIATSSRIAPGSVTVDSSRLYVAPYIMYDSNVTYSTTEERTASVKFTMHNVTSATLTKNSVEVVTNSCGSTSNNLVSEGKNGNGWMYRLDIKGITKSGDYVVAVKDSSGARYKVELGVKSLAKSASGIKDISVTTPPTRNSTVGIPATTPTLSANTLSWSIDATKIYIAPTVKTLAVEYPNEDGKAIVPFEVANATFTLAKENLNLSLGTTGASWTLEKVTSGTPAVGKTIRYNIVLTNVKSSGVVAGAVMNPNTKQIINISSGQVQAQVIYESVYKAPKQVKALLGSSMNYVTSNDKPCVQLIVSCNLEKMSASNIILQTNTCGAVVESFELDKTSLGKPVAGMYKLTISVKTPGAFSFSIKAPSGDRVEIVSNATLEAKFAKKTVSDKFLSPNFNVTEAEIKKVTPAKVKDLHFKGGSSEIEGMLKKDSDLKLDDSKLQTLPKVEDEKITNPKAKDPVITKPIRK